MLPSSSARDENFVKLNPPRKSFKLFDSTRNAELAGYDMVAIPTCGIPELSSHETSNAVHRSIPSKGRGSRRLSRVRDGPRSIGKRIVSSTESPYGTCFPRGFDIRCKNLDPGDYSVYYSRVP